MPDLPAAPLVRDAILSVLGRATGYRLNHTVNTTKCVSAVLTRFGLGGLGSRSREAGRIRRLEQMLRFKGLTVTPKRGAWSLTEHGIDRARELNKLPYDPHKNLTRQFLIERLPNGLYDSLIKSTAAKFHVSLVTDQVVDHVHTFLAKLIQRDSLRSRIALGKPIYPSQLASWCYRSAQNDIRALGTNPVSRTMFGALTVTERRTGKRYAKSPQKSWEISPFLRPAYDKRAQEKIKEGLQVVDNKPSVEDEVIEYDHAFKFWAEGAEVIRRSQPRNRSLSRDLRLLRAWAEGQTIVKISKEYGLSRTRVDGIISGLRKTLQQAGARGAFAEFA